MSDKTTQENIDRIWTMFDNVAAEFRNDFLDDLREFLDFFPKYSSYRIYGAVASLDVAEDADRYAYRRGLFVLGVVGDGIVQIKNDGVFPST